MKVWIPKELCEALGWFVRPKERWEGNGPMIFTSLNGRVWTVGSMNLVLGELQRTGFVAPSGIDDGGFTLPHGLEPLQDYVRARWLQNMLCG